MASSSDFSLKNGLLLVDKPLGISSFSVVARVRRICNVKKVGHGGTLDPLATGLMVLLLGNATKLFGAIAGGDKGYEARICLGSTSTTDDREGEITARKPFENIDEQMVRAALTLFQGKQRQVPPIFSAKKINGTAAYQFARDGRDITLEACDVFVHSIVLQRFQAPFLDFNLLCSKGTYVRSLARDLGKKLHCGAHLHALRRTKSGCFSLQNALPLESLYQISAAHMRHHMEENMERWEKVAEKSLAVSS
ncbi:MAG: tRNA pseudouridine(55) synthase TruB [Puniceicoccales bacterium]|jgi:tRNA pseudouridine55 synthase|nr:tRNA pseudouridine(55) synthase TruB [Puniceicoccales bacterium]